ncbi:sulfatase-like hydrolase/transferase [Candidatus Riflebacteria bacterium]
MSKSTIEKSPYVLHPFFLGAFPVVFLFSENYNFVPASQVILPLIVIEIFVVLFYLGLNLFFNNPLKTGLILSPLIFFFFSFGHFHLLYELSRGSLVSSQLKYLILVLLIISFCAFLYGIKYFLSSGSGLRGITDFLNVVSIALVTISTFSLGLTSMTSSSPKVEDVQNRPLQVKKTEKELPDIYFFLLDSYARKDVLKELYGYDNSAFLRYLKEKGFFVAARSRSNYPYTLATLSSLFNLKYHKFGPEFKNLTMLDNRIFTRQIWNNRVLPILKKLGYTTITFDSGSGINEQLVNSDIVFATSAWDLNDFQTMLINTTFLPYLTVALYKISKDYFIRDIYYSRRRKFKNMYKKMQQIIEEKYLKFVFVHILQPHEPFLFNADGSDNSPPPGVNGVIWFIPFKGRDKESYIKGYTQQLTFINNKVKTLIEQIFKSSGGKALILIQSDHGPALNLEPYSIEKTDLRERLCNLMAFYFPDREMYKYLSQDITPINTFPLIFNLFFGIKINLFKNRSFFSSIDQFYQFTDVTARLDKLQNNRK